VTTFFAALKALTRRYYATQGPFERYQGKDDPECGECRRWRGFANNTRQSRIVFVNDFGRHRSKSPCAVKRHTPGELWNG
jgi:hypothetical protein